MNRTTILCATLAGVAAAHIQPGSLNINRGTVWNAGQKVTISWAASIDHSKSPYTLWFSPDSGKTWNTVKTGIPGMSGNAAVTYEWTVPAQATKGGMIRVFQTFGGTVATNPSNPGDYTLFSPLFEIKSTTSVTPRIPGEGAQASLRLLGSRLVARFEALGSEHATLDVVGLDGSVRLSTTLPAPRAGENVVEVPLSGMELRSPAVARLRLDGHVVVQRILRPLD